MRAIIPVMVILLSFLISSCSSFNNQIVAKYGKYEISKDEFRDAYVKSVGGLEPAAKDSIDQIKDYLELFVNYKMKLRDAEVRGYDKEDELVQELENYKKQIARTYLEERFVVKPGIDELYENDKFEYKFAHIFIKPDTISRKEAYEFAQKIIDKVKAGESFEDLAAKYSADFATKNKGGEIYYIRPSQLPLPKFMEALESCKPGEVFSKPLMSSAGYHVIKLINKIPVRYQIRASHIMRDRVDDNGKPDSNAVTLLKGLLEQIKEGAPFDSLAKIYSEDKGSGANGGDLGFFKRRSMVINFDSVVFNLKVGEVSDIIETQFGYHIAKCTDEKEYPALKEVEEGLAKFFRKNYFAAKLDDFKAKLKEDYNYSYNEELTPFIKSKLDSAKLDSSFITSDTGKEFLNLTAFRIGEQQYPVEKLVDKYISEKRFAGRVVDSLLMSKMAEEYSEEEIFNRKMNDLEQNDSEFKSLIDEYKNGIMIFKLQEEEVWSEVKVDSAELRKYWEGVKDEYKTVDRVSYSFIKAKNDSIINYVYTQLKSGTANDSQFKKMKQEEGLIDVGIVDLAPADENIPAKEAFKLENTGDYTKPFKDEKSEYYIVQLIFKDKARVKTFEEAYNEVAGPYQEVLNKRADEKYIKNLKSIYQPEYNYEALNNLFDGEKK